MKITMTMEVSLHLQLVLFLSWILMVSLQPHCCISTSDVSLQLNDDVLGLIVFKSGLYDPSSSLASWNEDDNAPCSWNYVQCNPINNRVSHLSLEGLNLSGKISRGLEKLQSLQYLSLACNNFTGIISPNLSLIKSLRTLNLSRNGFSGRIPDGFISNIPSMAFIDFSENSISGPIPDTMFQNCASLRVFTLARNLLEGPVPSTLFTCKFLWDLNLSNNHLSGYPEFINGIWSLTRLRTLDLSHNEFSGFVPGGISAIHNLKELQLLGNHFSGTLPIDIGLCPHLSRLDFSDNSFTGALPDSLQRLTFVTFFGLSNNMFIGDFPQWIGNMSSLEYLDFSDNEFTGTLPVSLGDLKLLKYLSLADNKLTGEVPSTLIYCTVLSEVRLRGNKFNGSIPKGLFGFMLEEIDLSENDFTGKLPSEMGLLSSLRHLNLSSNNIRSTLPQDLGYFQSLSVLDLRKNAFYGSIPEDLCESNNLSILQLDSNSFTGSIPEEIGNCSSLYLLSLSHNNLNGSIPRDLSRLNKLKILNLEDNELSGQIPPDLGRLPTGGIFQNLDQSALQENLGICSPLLKGPCTMNVEKPLFLDPNVYNNPIGHSNSLPHRSSGLATFQHKRFRFLSVSAIVAMCGVVLIVIGVVVISLLNVSARRRLAVVENSFESTCSSSQKSGAPPMGKLVMLDSKSSKDWVHNAESLLSKATEIGKGVFGTVYKTSLGGEGGILAIKMVASNIIRYQEDFDKEVRILGQARHLNLMTLQGYYWTPEMQLLISDYASNGSLHSQLHERLASTAPLSWAKRFKIAVGTARGLAHLHHTFRPPIIHYNMKPSNILLDENYNPRISDFGLAKLLTKLDKHTISSRFQSALGYVAPELACQSVRINEKCDVYGYGVMILELITGKRPVEYGDDDVVILCDDVRVLLEQGNVLDCVDPYMCEYPEEEVLPVLKLGLVCTSQIPSSRPSMADVVQILQVIRTPVPQRMDMY
ncbi:hypothetical protein GIB67_023061 [Kingdonia uniflora]|uniref:non-specific serine/threonine protein kinase n=1 Tax=Kingdonia uniflora TaxID=39325 RepID=A0A7J7P7W8_9MAGN|nr:hypothetical protein GIB67_023061 [Kingdonia uniflora]